MPISRLRFLGGVAMMSPVQEEQCEKCGGIKKKRARLPDGGIGRHTLPPCATTQRITTISPKKQQPELSENQAVWKSDNQGFKEATFILKGAFYRESKELYLIHRNKHREVLN